MEDYVRTQQAEMEKDKKKGTLSFNLANRVSEVGLSALPADSIPSEEALL